MPSVKSVPIVEDVEEECAVEFHRCDFFRIDGGGAYLVVVVGNGVEEEVASEGEGHPEYGVRGHRGDDARADYRMRGQCHPRSICDLLYLPDISRRTTS